MLHRFSAGLLASGLVAILLRLVSIPSASLETAKVLAWQETPLFALSAEPDPAAEGVIRQYLKGWNAKGAVAANQGVWIQSAMIKPTTHQGTVPLPAASLTKIATTLAALNQWGPAHHFETHVSTTGPIKNGILQGDLVITGSGDPFFVWEEAIALGNSLNQLGIRRVTGSLVINGDFYMNYKEDPAIAGQLLYQGLNAKSWPPIAAIQHKAMPPGTAKPEVAIAGGVKVATLPIPKKILLLRHQSLSLTQILKEMNVYSNNEMAEMLANSVGGAQVTSQLAAKSADVPAAEILLVNGSGLGVENRISPRAVCAMLMAVDRFLEPHQMNVADIFPVAGRDKRGTMHARHLPVGTTIKTGTLRDVSALAGLMPTRDRGQVWFAIINRGGNVEEFRQQQDQLLGSLSKVWGAKPTINASTSQAPVRLGDPNRNEKIYGIQAQL